MAQSAHTSLYIYIEHLLSLKALSSTVIPEYSALDHSFLVSQLCSKIMDLIRTFSFYPVTECLRYTGTVHSMLAPPSRNLSYAHREVSFMHFHSIQMLNAIVLNGDGSELMYGTLPGRGRVFTYLVVAKVRQEGGRKQSE